MHLYLKTEFQHAFRSDQITKWTASSPNTTFTWLLILILGLKRSLRLKLHITFFHTQTWMRPQFCDEAKKSFERLHGSDWRIICKGTWGESDWSKMLCFVSIWNCKLKNHLQLLCNQSSLPAPRQKWLVIWEPQQYSFPSENHSYSFVLHNSFELSAEQAFCNSVPLS